MAVGYLLWYAMFRPPSTSACLQDREVSGCLPYGSEVITPRGRRRRVEVPGEYSALVMALRVLESM